MHLFNQLKKAFIPLRDEGFFAVPPLLTQLLCPTSSW